MAQSATANRVASGILPRFLGVLIVLDGIAILIWFLQALLWPTYEAGDRWDVGETLASDGRSEPLMPAESSLARSWTSLLAPAQSRVRVTRRREGGVRPWVLEAMFTASP